MLMQCVRYSLFIINGDINSMLLSYYHEYALFHNTNVVNIHVTLSITHWLVSNCCVSVTLVCTRAIINRASPLFTEKGNKTNHMLTLSTHSIRPQLVSNMGRWEQTYLLCIKS